MREREKNKSLFLLQDMQNKANRNNSNAFSSNALKIKSYNSTQNAELKVYSSKCEQNENENESVAQLRNVSRNIGQRGMRCGVLCCVELYIFLFFSF